MTSRKPIGFGRRKRRREIGGLAFVMGNRKMEGRVFVWGRSVDAYAPGYARRGHATPGYPHPMPSFGLRA